MCLISMAALDDCILNRGQQWVTLTGIAGLIILIDHFIDLEFRSDA
jgi:hypothetical protein